jgi:hypothetical protein
MQSLAEVLFEIKLADWAFGALDQPVLDAGRVKGVKAYQEGLFLALADIVETDGAVTHFPIVNACR